MKQIYLLLKRTFDIIFAALGLVILAPIYAIISILLKLQNNGPVFFKQERIGYQGKPFIIYKFRTMGSQIEEKGPQLIAKCTPEQASPLERFLRQQHLDELPQLWNVLRGDMSFVGPRPERKYFIDQIMANDSRYACLYEMRPGLTSEATLYNGYTDTMEKMLRRLQMDLDYLDKRSLWLDLQIVAKTGLSLISGKKI